jgi:hypothetical protein
MDFGWRWVWQIISEIEGHVNGPWSENSNAPGAADGERRTTNEKEDDLWAPVRLDGG